MGPGALTELLKNLSNHADQNLLVGFDGNDDACVYRVTDEIAIIQTVDFFTPIVDDPYTFGQIAAANAISDVYAMGGTPHFAMNLLCIPTCLPAHVTRAILEGGHAKAVEAGCVIAGGHTIQDEEPKYGLCVTGFVHPDKILRNIGAQPGDVLVLTKPVGSGIITTGIKADLVSDRAMQSAYKHMSTLNAQACQAMKEIGSVHACTDITGFGLLGHCYEMASGSHVTIQIDAQAIPLMEEALSLASMGIIPAGAYRNMEYVAPYLHVEESVQQALVDLAADPQTSGGLLIALPPDDASELIRKLHCFAPWCAVVGKVLPQESAILKMR